MGDSLAPVIPRPDLRVCWNNFNKHDKKAIGIPVAKTRLALILFRLPLCYVLSKQLGMIGIWTGMASSNVVQGLMFPFWFRQGRGQGVRVD
jgi:hypothetical protein